MAAAMSLYGPKQLATSARSVRANTIAVAEDIPETHYRYRATPESRSVEEILLHIIVNTQATEQMHGQPDRIGSSRISVCDLCSESAWACKMRSNAEFLGAWPTDGLTVTKAIGAYDR